MKYTVKIHSGLKNRSGATLAELIVALSVTSLVIAAVAVFCVFLSQYSIEKGVTSDSLSEADDFSKRLTSWFSLCDNRETDILCIPGGLEAVKGDIREAFHYEAGLLTLGNENYSYNRIDSVTTESADNGIYIVTLTTSDGALLRFVLTKRTASAYSMAEGVVSP